MLLGRWGLALWFIWFFWRLYVSQCSWFVCIYCWGKIIFSFLSHNFSFCSPIINQFYPTLELYLHRPPYFSFWDGWSFFRYLFFSCTNHDPHGRDCALWFDGICWDEVYCEGCSCYILFWTLCGSWAYWHLILWPSTTIKLIILA